MTTPAPPDVAVAVVGARDSGADAVRAALTANDATLRVVRESADPPDVAVLAVDSVCPIRPDDLAIARGIAARTPLVVASTGHDGSVSADETTRMTTRRLADRGVPAEVVGWKVDGPELTSGLVDAVHRAAAAEPTAPPPPTPSSPEISPKAIPPPAEAPPKTIPSPAPSPPTPAEIADWLVARRTEVVTARSSALRQDVHALRLELAGELQRAHRDISAHSRERLRATSRPDPDLATRELSAYADERVAAVARHTETLTARLRGRHMGSAHRVPASPAPPVAGFTVPPLPVYRAEEALMLVTGVAAGAGIGRLLLSPFEDASAPGFVVLPIVLVVGLGLGVIMAAVRRRQGWRAHLLGVLTEQIAGLRADMEHHIGNRVLAAESDISDGFAHAPGPRVADLDRRIRRIRRGDGVHTNGGRSGGVGVHGDHTTA